MDGGAILTIDDPPRNAELFASVPGMYGFENERPGIGLRVASGGVQLVD